VRRKKNYSGFFSIETVIQLYNMNNSFEVIEKAMIFNKKKKEKKRRERNDKPMIMTDHVLVDIILKKDCSIIGDGYQNLLFIFCLLFHIFHT
jgi:hypothetical protein